MVARTASARARWAGKCVLNAVAVSSFGGLVVEVVGDSKKCGQVRLFFSIASTILANRLQHLP